MARIVYFALVFVCLFYIYQASPMPQADSTESSNLEDNLKHMFTEVQDSINKRIEDLKNNPTLQKVAEDINNFAKKAYEGVSEKINEMHSS